jgi:hypothetical protein
MFAWHSFTGCGKPALRYHSERSKGSLFVRCFDPGEILRCAQNDSISLSPYLACLWRTAFPIATLLLGQTNGCNYLTGGRDFTLILQLAETARYNL